MQYDPGSIYLVSADRTKCLVDITHMFVLKQVEPPDPAELQGPELYEGDTGFNFWDGYLPPESLISASNNGLNTI
jgi:hypothetical protein